MAQNIGTLQRKLSTLIEELLRARSTWDEINSHAFPAANTLTNLVIQSRYVDETQYWHPQLTMEFPNIIQKFDAKMQLLIQKQNAVLAELVDKMAKQYTKMQNIQKELLTVYERTRDSHGAAFVDQQAVFLTCPLKTYMARLGTITDMFKSELNTKRSMVSATGFSGLTTREEGVVLLSIWLNQPSIVKSTLQDWDDICSTEMNA
ncbi:hypothetical protein V8B55DRAFT_1467419 [Mucor lusitanicus]|uniref:Uncharacterized protein n=2 Tax=Mucor circinelloides f. lusitanicus TaxID=29924 RepID=A0A162QP85_MUCCL|nr:hypothetical protein FB192DRAFT_1356699 [Mucor lusitanicus]OAD01079.1 hypothetical protein MUCCIDRAFT_84798 [Mucor lusitanicus CBS 277.49]